MSMPKDSTKYTVMIATAVCLVCSVIVSTAAVMLKPTQEANKTLDRKRNILSVAGMLEPGKSIEELFAQFETRVVNFETGDYVSDIDAEEYDQRAASADPERSIKLDKKDDIANIRRRAKLGQVYQLMQDGQVKLTIIPLHGYGLWSTLYGYLALEGDANTVVGMGFYDHAETPGLGGEVDNPKWKAQWPGKKVFNAEGEAAITVTKGGNAKPDSPHEIDGLSGATLTTYGVDQLVKFWLGENGWGPYLKKIRAKQS